MRWYKPGRHGSHRFQPFAFPRHRRQRSKDALFHAAHDIKGEAATFGFPAVASAAQSLCRLIEHTLDIARAVDTDRPACRRGACYPSRVCALGRETARNRPDQTATRRAEHGGIMVNER